MVAYSGDWHAGAKAEAAARDEGLASEVIEYRDMLADLSRVHPEDHPRDLLIATAAIAWAGQPLRARLAAAWRFLR